MKCVLQRAICVLVVTLGACAPRAATTAGPADPHAGHDMPTAAPGGQHAEHAKAEPAPAPGVNPADVKFMQDMIGHHAQALVMAAMAPTHGASDMVLRLAEKIDISQRDEILMMKDWLTTRGQALPDEHSHHAMQMPGMLTPDQLAELGRARDREFDRLFLSYMIQHHEGALVMVDVLFASPGAGQDPDIFRFATDVATDQLDEIDVMTHMLSLLANGEDE